MSGKTNPSLRRLPRKTAVKIAQILKIGLKNVARPSAHPAGLEPATPGSEGQTCVKSGFIALMRKAA
jgi:hypothetical protein